MAWMKRTHTCGELRVAHEGAKVVLNGWVDRVRDHGGVLFVDLRDRYGKTQAVFRQSAPAAALKPEWVVAVRGVVARRTPGTVNAKLPTGGIEVVAEELEVLNEAKTPPFEIRDVVEVAQEVRLKYRYLDLRRPVMQRNLELRHRLTHAVREFLDRERFLDLETPYMIRSTPGGARNFLVPSRHFAGHFFGLAESPQIFKQLLMVAGYDRYYQIARCFRDEDLRADRQIEFTQVDLEMAFVHVDDVLGVVEAAVAHAFEKTSGAEVPLPFPRLTYEEATERFGTDKPDLRFGLELRTVSAAFEGTSFRVVREALDKGGAAVALVIPGGAGASRKQISDWETFIKGHGVPGLISFKIEAEGIHSAWTKHMEPGTAQRLRDTAGANVGDLILLVAGEAVKSRSALGALRCHVWEAANPNPPRQWRLCWVVDFPLFDQDESGRIVARHHPFTSPRDEDLAILESRPREAKAKAYDLVLNGVEIGGGSVRIHRRDVQQRVFRLLGITDAEAQEKFRFLLEAFEYGAPPHGGIALGLDRIAMLLAGADSIREVIPFPKTQRTTDLMTGAPAPATDAQLAELHIRAVEPPGGTGPAATSTS